MRRAVVAVTGSVVVVGILVAAGPAPLRPWNCRSHVARQTSRAALDAYYASCWSRPTKIAGPYDGGTGTQGYQQWTRLDEFTVHYGRHKTRFVLVGEKKAGGTWRVLDGEGTGP